MKNKSTSLIKYASLLLTLILISACKDGASHHHADSHGHSHGEEEPVKGEHGGRLLTEGSFAIELKIFEVGVPPQYRVYGYYDHKPIPPQDLKVDVILNRPGGRSDKFEFNPVHDFLTSERVVEEPHSFAVVVKSEYAGKKYSWEYDSWEGRTVISQAVADLSQIKTEKADSRSIKSVLLASGKVLPSESKVSHVMPRFAGVVREVKKHIGDKVQKGEVLAVIESNQGLQPFEVRSQISGSVISGHLIAGEFVPENQTVFVIADLSEVWVDFFIPLRRSLAVKNNQIIKISNSSGEELSEGTISYIAPYADEKSQTQLIRVIAPNTKNNLLPGMFVNGALIVNQTEAMVAIKKSAIQKFRDWQVVFLKFGDVYQVQPLELGESDAEWFQVLAGLTAGQEYVTENSFLIKADILKSGASHDH